MKLRIRGNSLRLRLTRSEVDQFNATGKVEETVDFGAGQGQFTYALERVDGDGGIFATYENGRICVCVPRAQSSKWIDTELVGIESEDLPDSGPRILIEKDFSCLTPRADEDESDMFPNPDAAAC